MQIPMPAMIAIAAVAAIAPAKAQTFDPNFPVCMHVFGAPTYYECRFMSLAQCAQSASGRGAQCIVNPYVANAYQAPRGRHPRRHRHLY
jgi:uncharacterized protein DUF3551